MGRNGVAKARLAGDNINPRSTKRLIVYEVRRCAGRSRSEGVSYLALTGYFVDTKKAGGLLPSPFRLVPWATVCLAVAEGMDIYRHSLEGFYCPNLNYATIPQAQENTTCPAMYENIVRAKPQLTR